MKLAKHRFGFCRSSEIIVKKGCDNAGDNNENEEVMQWLHDSEDVESLRLTLDPQWGVTEIIQKNIYGYRLFPHRVKGEGFFISVARKLSDGGQRTFLADGDTVIIRGYAVANNIRIGFGDCKGKIVAAL